jgi:hypothetical protein
MTCTTAVVAVFPGIVTRRPNYLKG